MEKAYDYIVADYAGNRVKINGEEYKVGACCVDLLNSFNGPEEGKEFEVSEERFDVLRGNNPYKAVFVEEIKEIEVAKKEPKTEKAVKKTTKKAK